MQLLASFADVVPASVWGHHHTASVRLLPLAARAVAAGHVLYLSPSLTPRNPPHDPAVRLYRYDRQTARVVDWMDFSFDLRLANRRGALRWEAQSPLGAPPLNLSSLTPSAWRSALSRLLGSDAPDSREVLRADDPFFEYLSAERCTDEVYVESGPPDVPALRRCKLAVLCAQLHLEDWQYAECIGQ